MGGPSKHAQEMGRPPPQAGAILEDPVLDFLGEWKLNETFLRTFNAKLAGGGLYRSGCVARELRVPFLAVGRALGWCDYI